MKVFNDFAYYGSVTDLQTNFPGELWHFPSFPSIPGIPSSRKQILIISSFKHLNFYSPSLTALNLKQDITDQHCALSVTQYRLLHYFLALISNWFSECFRYAKQFRINYIVNDWFVIRNQWEIEICRVYVANGNG